jgi:WhiB family redox-sensing transcriptional regulator
VPPVTSGVRSVSWMSRGACRHADPALFFPLATGKGPAERQAKAAKAVCAPCAVRADCLSYALEAKPEGIWGGTTPDERRAARRRPPPPRASVQSAGPASAVVTGENAARPGRAAGQPAPPGRTA